MLQVKTFSLEAFGNVPGISSGPLASCTKVCSLREKRTPAPSLNQSVNLYDASPNTAVSLYVLGMWTSPSTPKSESKGGGNGVIFNVDDCRATYEALRERGVEFTQEPTEHFYGIDCGLRDPFGNPLRITQPAPGPIEVPSAEELAANADGSS